MLTDKDDADRIQRNSEKHERAAAPELKSRRSQRRATIRTDSVAIKKIGMSHISETPR